MSKMLGKVTHSEEGVVDMGKAEETEMVEVLVGGRGAGRGGGLEMGEAGEDGVDTPSYAQSRFSNNRKVN